MNQYLELNIHIRNIIEELLYKITSKKQTILKLHKFFTCQHLKRNCNDFTI